MLLLVSDGVGSAAAGEVASRTAVDLMQELLQTRLSQNPPPADRRGWLDAAIRETDHRIRALSQQPEFSGMAATLSALWIEGDRGWWGQAGDSRIYRLRQRELRQISRDQSPVGRLRANGELTEAQARVHRYRHLVDQCLGGGGPAVEPDTGAIDVVDGDIFLLCSDGLSDGLWDHEIAQGLLPVLAGQPLETVARALVDSANEASGKDNITALLGHVTAGAAPKPARSAWWRWFR